jgi:LacI family transcriptional regulator
MTKPPPTLAEIARVAGVSPMTASRALNNRSGVSPGKRREILLIADELGYAVNRAAQHRFPGGTRVIGVIAPLETPFAGDLAMGIGSAARAAGYEMLLYALNADDRAPPAAALEFLQRLVDGVIALRPGEPDEIAALAAARVPVVAIEPRAEAPGIPAIVGDGYQGARLAVRHLADLGHRRIAFIAGDERLPSARDRRRGYEDTMRALELPLSPGLIAGTGAAPPPGFDAAARLLDQSPRPTAILAAGALEALGAISALREAGLRVPEDVAVAGFDDLPLAAQVRPSLTTVRQPTQPMGRAAVNTLLALIVGLEAPSEVITLPAELVIRETTGGGVLISASERPHA